MEKKIINGNGFTQMIDMQKSLLNEYMEIENLPPYPLDMDKRLDQKLIKDWVGRMIEELAEAYTSLGKALHAVSHNRIVEARRHVRDYNEEIADAVHFLLEILIYSGIENDELDNIFKEQLHQDGLDNIYKEGNVLATLFGLGYFQNFSNDISIKPRLAFHIFSQQEAMADPTLGGGRKISGEALLTHAQFLWGVTVHFKMAANQLKNRDWSQEEKRVNQVLYQENLLKGIIELFQYFDFAGLSELGLFQSYVNKNNINYQRIKSGY